MERLEEIENKINEVELEIGRLKNEKADREDELSRLKHELLIEIGHATEVETENYHFTRSIPNPAKQSAYRVSSAVFKKDQEQQIAWLKANHPQLVEQQEKVNNKTIREMLAEGTFQVAENGKVVDENGEIIPGVFGELKPETVDVKALTK